MNYSSDHLCNLYGPTIVHEDKKGNIFFETDIIGDEKFGIGIPKSPDGKQYPINGGGEEPGPVSDRSPLPPPIPPRTTRALSMITPPFFSANFRTRAGTESTVTLLNVPPLDRSRRPSREEVEAVRMAFRQNPYARVSLSLISFLIVLLIYFNPSFTF